MVSEKSDSLKALIRLGVHVSLRFLKHGQFHTLSADICSEDIHSYLQNLNLVK